MYSSNIREYQQRLEWLLLSSCHQHHSSQQSSPRECPDHRISLFNTDKERCYWGEHWCSAHWSHVLDAPKLWWTKISVSPRLPPLHWLLLRQHVTKTGGKDHSFMIEWFKSSSQLILDQSQRDYVMQTMCELTQDDHEEVKVAAVECLNKLVITFYPLMEEYLAPALIPISLQSIQSSNRYWPITVHYSH